MLYYPQHLSFTWSCYYFLQWVTRYSVLHIHTLLWYGSGGGVTMWSRSLQRYAWSLSKVRPSWWIIMTKPVTGQHSDRLLLGLNFVDPGKNTRRRWMAEQQSFLGIVRKQMHSVCTIIQLLVFDNCPPINVWQFFLFDWLQLSNVSLGKDGCSLLFCCDVSLS